MKREKDSSLAFLDTMIINNKRSLSFTWYHKPTDTGLVMNFHSLASNSYKISVVSGFVYLVYRACSTWKHFHDSLEKAKRALEQNQYPPKFYGPIVHETLTIILSRGSDSDDQCNDSEEGSQQEMEIKIKDTRKSFSLFLQWKSVRKLCSGVS